MSFCRGDTGAPVGSALFAFLAEANVMYIFRHPLLVPHVPTSWHPACSQSLPHMHVHTRDLALTRTSNHPERIYVFSIFSISTHRRIIDTAAKQLTKTAITVTAIFIVALGYDLWYYVLGYSGVIEYKMNTPLQKIGKCI